jgi:small subunit ribosomal protein S2
MNPVSIREMLECGVHFGHPVRRWNPKMKKFIFGARNGISIIDLQKTARLAKKALEAVTESAANGGKVMFVGTKRQAYEVIREQAERSDNYFVNHRWLGGFMTNFATIQQSVKKLKNFDELLVDEGRLKDLKKKEISKLEKKRERMERVLCGVKDMKRLPSIVFVVDIMKEHLAVAEAIKLKIPVVAVVDSNCDPDNIDYIIPGNDDAIRAIAYFAEKVAEASMAGAEIYKTKKAEAEAAKAAERAEMDKKRADERKRRDAERRDRDKAAAVKKAADKAAAAKAPAPKADAPKADAAPAKADAKPAAPKEAKPAADKKPARAAKKPVAEKVEKAEDKVEAKEESPKKEAAKKPAAKKEAIADDKAEAKEEKPKKPAAKKPAAPKADEKKEEK